MTEHLTSIVSWFDPLNHQHINAYQYLMDTGMWPKGFIPDNVYLPAHWQISLINKLADAWVEYMSTKEREVLQ